MAEELILSDEGVAGLLVDWRCDPAEFRKRVESMTHRIERAAVQCLWMQRRGGP